MSDPPCNFGHSRLVGTEIYKSKCNFKQGSGDSLAQEMCLARKVLALLQADTLSDATPIQRIIPGSSPFGEYLDVSNTTLGLIMTRR